MIRMATPEIRILDHCYIDYSTLGISFTKYPVGANNDEWQILRDFSLADKISKLEECYLYEHKLDLGLIKESLDSLYFLCKEPRREKEHAFWVSLRDRLQHLQQHPEATKVFEVECVWLQSAESWVIHYKDPVAVSKLVRMDVPQPETARTGYKP